MSSIFRRPRAMTLALSLSLPLLGAFVARVAAPGPAAPPYHPHFPKELTCKVTKDLTITVRYQTVTFDAAAAKALEPGKAWHLAGAEFESTADLVIGGQEVEAGKYALSARKLPEQRWELVLHPGNRFSTKIGPDAHVLATQFVADAPKFEHLNIDVQPGGDKQHTKLFLDVRFDTLFAEAEIAIPE